MAGGFGYRPVERFNVKDPEQRRQLIKSGLIWNLWEEAQDLAVQDLIADPSLINEWTPGDVVKWVRAQRGEEIDLGEENEEGVGQVPDTDLAANAEDTGERGGGPVPPG